MISIITPILDEEEYIKPFLENLGKLSGSFEIILVDGGSSDRTVEYLDNYNDIFRDRVVLLKTNRGRANQMNLGAQRARGDILLFLHVDCRLHKNSLNLIEEEVKLGKAIGGGFIQSYENSDSFFTIVSVFGNFRASLTKTFFGDYGIFIRKDIFRKVRGFDDLYFLEDVEFCRKVKKHGKMVQIRSIIICSSRRYQSKGRVRLSIAFISVYIFNLFGIFPKFLSRYLIEK